MTLGDGSRQSRDLTIITEGKTAWASVFVGRYPKIV